MAFAALMNLLVGASTANLQPIHPDGVRMRRKEGEGRSPVPRSLLQMAVVCLYFFVLGSRVMTTSTTYGGPSAITMCDIVTTNEPNLAQIC